MTLNEATPWQHFEWSQLINALVEIRHNGQTIRKGIVEDAMPDDSALWITADHTGPRKIFEACEGHQVWVTPQELAGNLSYRMTTNQISRKPSELNIIQAELPLVGCLLKTTAMITAGGRRTGGRTAHQARGR